MAANRVAYCIRIDASPQRLWTTLGTGTKSPFPSGLTISSLTYLHRPILFDAVTESADGTARLALTLTIANGDNLATDLVSDPAQRSVRVVVTQVTFDASWAVASWEVWFDGVTGQTRFEAETIVIPCSVNSGRRGPTPNIKAAAFMTAHTPPAPNAQIGGGG